MLRDKRVGSAIDGGRVRTRAVVCKRRKREPARRAGRNSAWRGVSRI